MLNETSLRPSEGLIIITVLVYFAVRASQGKNPNKGHGYTDIHPWCSAPHLTSNETLLKGKDQLRA